MSLAQYSDEYKKKNPNSQVPCFEDTNGFVVYESHAIMRYLCDTRDVHPYFYPKDDLKQRALIDQYLDGHHLNLRMGCGGFIYRKYVMPALGKSIP